MTEDIDKTEYDPDNPGDLDFEDLDPRTYNDSGVHTDCPICKGKIKLFEDDGLEIGSIVLCDHCGSELELVNTDPFEVAEYEEAK